MVRCRRRASAIRFSRSTSGVTLSTAPRTTPSFRGEWAHPGRPPLIQKGDIRWFRFQSPDKRRPVLILGHEQLLPALSQVPVVPLSTHARGLPWEPVLSQADGLPSSCVLKPEWIKAVDRAQIGPWTATLPAARWPEFRRVLLHVLGL
jgi:mRNA-degrading endonuclease toxin of MazEF toxin-antitoxin module